MFDGMDTLQYFLSPLQKKYIRIWKRRRIRPRSYKALSITGVIL